MNDGLSALFWGVVTFSFLIIIHEGGHFLAARLFGVKVHEFMVGLPGPAIRYHGKKTTYGVTAIPLGGYVRIAGMEPGPEEPGLGQALAVITREGTANAFDVASAMEIDEQAADALLITLADWDALEPVEGDEYTYRSRFAPEDAGDVTALLDRARQVTYRALPLWKRVVVLTMGVLLNLLTAILVFTVVLTAFPTYQDTGRLGAVAPASGAARAGIEAGDRIVSVGGVATDGFQDLLMTVARFEAGEKVEVRFERDGVVQSGMVTLGQNEETKRALLGVSPEYREARMSVTKAFATSFSYIGLTFVAIIGFFNPQTFQASISLSSSVIQASVDAADAVKDGPISFAYLVAALSLSLGVINILPIPPLDGGKVALEIIEGVRGRPLPRSLSLGFSAAGALLLFSLIGYLMYADIAKIVGG